VHNNLHEGKLGVLCLAPKEGMGVTDPELRAKIGEEKLTIFRRAN
jgi:crotonyl-CoA reductase